MCSIVEERLCVRVAFSEHVMQEAPLDVASSAELVLLSPQSNTVTGDIETMRREARQFSVQHRSAAFDAFRGSVSSRTLVIGSCVSICVVCVDWAQTGSRYPSASIGRPAQRRNACTSTSTAAGGSWGPLMPSRRALGLYAMLLASWLWQCSTALVGLLARDVSCHQLTS
jgi:hypothetical protein